MVLYRIQLNLEEAALTSGEGYNPMMDIDLAGRVFYFDARMLMNACFSAYILFVVKGYSINVEEFDGSSSLLGVK